MKKPGVVAEIEELKRRVKELEDRPYTVLWPIVVPTQAPQPVVTPVPIPVYPSYPWYDSNHIVCSASTLGTDATNATV